MKKYSLLLFSFFCFSIHYVHSQCAMCKATAESSLDTGNSMALGINAGILYLIPIPYLVFGVVGYFWYRTYWHKGQLKEEV